MELPLRPTGEGSHSCATICPLIDYSLQSFPEATRVIRNLFHSCHNLALAAEHAPEVSSIGPLLHIFEQPLEAQLRTRRDNLFTAARAGLELSHDSAMWQDQCIRGVCTPWALTKQGEQPSPRLQELWCRGNGEMQLQLLSFTVAQVLPPADRLRALSSRDTCARLEVEAAMLRGFNERLRAETALRLWASGHGTSGERQRGDVA